MSELTKTAVMGVYVVMTRQGPAPIVVLRDDKDRFLPIFIGYAEAISIRMILEGITVKTPFLHELFLSILKNFGASLQKVAIELTPEDTYQAALSIEDKEGKARQFVGRPGDGIALGLRMKIPIFVSEKAISKYGVPWEQIKRVVSEEEAEER